MNKAYTIAALAGFLGLSAPNPSILSSQENGDPLMFGQNRDVTYTETTKARDSISGLPFSNTENQGTAYLNSIGFELSGVLDGARFLYKRTPIADVFEIERNGTRIRYVDFPANDYRSDQAVVNGHVVFENDSKFFESTQPLQSPQAVEERLVSILSDYKHKLNVDEAQRRAEALRPAPTQQEVQESLDAFVR
jgi:hypothetical protein